jgi:type IV secretion system protein VirB2
MLHAIAFAASVSGSLSDPAGASPLVAAVLWLQNTLLGTIATTVAVIAVASVGVMMLTGRLELRRGATVIVGCFILFGATSIAAGIRSATAGFGDQAYEPPLQASASAGVVVPVQPHQNYDPYAGASVPRR